MTELRRTTIEGVPVVVVTPDELDPVNQEMHRQVAESCQISNRRAALRRLKIARVLRSRNHEA